MLDIYGRLSVNSKVNGTIFRQAVVQLCGRKGASIRDSNDGSAVSSSELQKTISFIGTGIRRKASRICEQSSVKVPGLATSGSWINYGWYIANSPVLKELWSAPSADERDLFAGYLGYDPWKVGLKEWSLSSELFYQILTARLWLRERRLM
jgi:hypothetical protein